MNENTQNLTQHLAANLAQIEDQILAACRAANRPRTEVELMSVSKTHPATSLIAAAQLGLTLFGENRVQEWQSKSEAFRAATSSLTPSPRANLIGHLQSNKAARAVELFDAIDSVDSLKLAERLNEAAQKLNKTLPILLEIKLSHEDSKAGLSPQAPETAQLLERLPSLANLRLSGLMTIPPLDVPEAETRACFRSLRTLRDQWSALHPTLDFSTLSMGMSGDFPLAILEGATRIRIGTALFGHRQ